MAKHYNPSISQDTARILNTKAGQAVDENISELTPVVVIERYCDLVKSGSSSNSTGGTVFTAAADKDTYITAMSLSFTRDATATWTLAAVRATIQGVVTNLFTFAGTTLTAGRGDVFVALPKPIKMDRNTPFSTIIDTAVANFTLRVTVFGYTVETTKDV